MNVSEERKLILQMVAEGKITPEEADSLLQALDETERATHSAATEQAEQAPKSGDADRLDVVIERTVKDSLNGLDQMLRRMEIDLERRLNDPARDQLIARIEAKMRHSAERAVERVKREEERAARIAERASRRAEVHARHAAERMERVFRAPDGPRPVFFKAGFAIDRVQVERNRTFTLPAAPGDRLNLENRVGTIRVDFYDGSEIQVDVKAQVWGEDEADANERADAYLMSLVRRGSDVTLEVVRPTISAVGFLSIKETRLDYTVRVPHGVDLQVHSKAGDIVVVAGDKVGSWLLVTKVGDIDMRVGQDAGFTYDLSTPLGAIRAQLAGDEVGQNDQDDRRGAYRTGRVGDGTGRVEVAVKKTGDIRLTH